ncbi:DUF742 domain-containing protein [Saccharomonospora azurea]|uniref:DUF742 domain-containing protein n=1 Tax=Saccharomonospora azurea NA-128 TaxID=882081 RepID=H8G3T6_9PSEU|nr:DUF742 domain-containing protein [Saccharomonospora azurea]EHY89104.1 Protein of unknown function (DUF742) [Saccharomonospora azurea NA-128]
MDTGHSRGDRRLDRDRVTGGWPSEPEDAAFSGRGGRGRRPSRRVDDPLDTGEWLRSGGLDSPGPADFDLADYSRSSLFSGPGAELYGMGGGGFSDEATSGYDDRGHGYGRRARDTGSYDTGSYDTGSYDTGAYDAGPGSGELSRPSLPRHPRDVEPEESSGLVRPYFRTRGRTKPDYDLAIEALISTSERGRRLERVRVPEHRSICGLCLDTRSVAEVAALLKMPLGVVRILVGDVAGLGLVLVHSASSSMVGDRPSIEFMERVLSGLRRI